MIYVVLMIVLSFLLPIGGWFEFEGYEFIGLIFLFLGWTPIAVLIGDQFIKNSEEMDNEDR